MDYEWGCGACRVQTPKGWKYVARILVTRTSMAGSSVPPWHDCTFCKKRDWVKLVSITSKPALDRGVWPMRLSHIEKVLPVKDAKGNVIGSRREQIVAENKSEYDRILKERDLVMYCEGEDSTVNTDSQHSAWGQYERAAPSERAEKLYQMARAVDPNEPENDQMRQFFAQETPTLSELPQTPIL